MKTADIKVGERIRRYYGDGNIDEWELTDSIRQAGIVTPIVVDKDGNLLAGERRWRVARFLGLEEVPVFVSDAETELEKLLIETEENKGRKAWSKQEMLECARKIEALEHTAAVERQKAGIPLATNCQRSDVSAADAIGVSRETFRRMKYIDENASEEQTEAWNNGDITTSALYKELKKQNDEMRDELNAMKTVVQNNATARLEAEQQYADLQKKIEIIINDAVDERVTDIAQQYDDENAKIIEKYETALNQRDVAIATDRQQLAEMAKRIKAEERRNGEYEAALDGITAFPVVLAAEQLLSAVNKLISTSVRVNNVDTAKITQACNTTLQWLQHCTRYEAETTIIQED